MTSQLKIDINGLSQTYPLVNSWTSDPAFTSNGCLTGALGSQRGRVSRSFPVERSMHRKTAISSRVNKQYMAYYAWVDIAFNPIIENSLERKKAEVIDISYYLRKDIYQDLKDRVSEYSAIESNEDFEAPSMKTIQDALFFIDNIIKKQGVKVGKVRPVADGEINFFWNNAAFTLDIALYGDNKYYYYFEEKYKGIKYSQEKSLDESLDDAALDMIKSKW